MQPVERCKDSFSTLLLQRKQEWSDRGAELRMSSSRVQQVPCETWAEATSSKEEIRSQRYEGEHQPTDEKRNDQSGKEEISCLWEKFQIGSE